MRSLILREGLPGKRALFIVLLVLIAFSGGCVVYEPVPYTAYHGSSYERVWNAALGAAEDAGVRITSAARSTGVIRGVASTTEATITVMTQADGRIRVEFSSKGPRGEDAALNERLTRYYNMRMGRI
jgi:hypothetical protein